MNFQATDASRSRSAADIVHEALRDAIVQGNLASGVQLRQEEVARASNVSRIPVREAILRLEQQGLVENRRYRGAFVTALSTDEIDEVFRLRALIESDAIRHAVPRMTATALTEAREALEAFSRTSDPAQLMDQNRRFHCALYAAGQQPVYMGVINGLLDQSDRYLRAQLSLTQGQDRAAREHLLILDVVQSGDAERAADLTKAHVTEAGAALLDYLGQERGGQSGAR